MSRSLMGLTGLVFCMLCCVDSAHAGKGTNAKKYRRFAKKVETLIRKARPVVESRGEAADVRTVAHLLRDFNKDVAAARWGNAARQAKRMQVPLKRVWRIAKVAPQRAAEREDRFARRESRIRALKAEGATLRAAMNWINLASPTGRQYKRDMERVRSELSQLQEERDEEKALYALLLRESRP